jgi:hypothetical protein
MPHLRVRILHILRRIRALSIPSPFLHQFRLQLALKHLGDILAQYREEFETME